MNRENVSPICVETAIDGIMNSLDRSRLKHGTHEYASVHETLGIVAEEYYELIEAIKSGNKQDIISELEDIAVGCLWGIASLKQQMNTKDAMTSPENAPERRVGEAEQDWVSKTIRDGMAEVARLDAEVERLTKEKAEAMADTQRLDWLEAEHARIDPVAAMTVKWKLDRGGSEWANIVQGVRRTIDDTRAALSLPTPAPAIQIVPCVFGTGSSADGSPLPTTAPGSHEE